MAVCDLEPLNYPPQIHCVLNIAAAPSRTWMGDAHRATAVWGRHGT